jgi:hypothetical protein
MTNVERNIGDTMGGWLIIQFLLVILLGPAQLIRKMKAKEMGSNQHQLHIWHLYIK